MDSFNGVAKTTIGRGKEEKLAGQILTFNIKEGERIPEKIDEGRLLIQVYEKVPATLSVEDAYEEKTAFNQAMAEPELPRDFLAKFGCRFQQKPGMKSEFQRSHKKALLHLAQAKPGYDNRKLECYALPLAVYFLIEAMVEEEEDETAKRLLVEAFKDTESVIQGLMYEMGKVDELLESMGSSRSARLQSANTSLEVQVRIAETREELLENLDAVLDSFEGAGMVEVTKYIKIHESSKNYLSIAHSRLKNRAGGKAWKKGWGLPEIHADLKTKIAQFTNMTSSERYTGSDWTGAAGCKQILIQILPLGLKQKVAELLCLDLDELIDGEQQVAEFQSSQSQAFPAFSQSQGADTVRVCKLSMCNYQTQISGEMDMHLETHPRCIQCGKRFLTPAHLTEHMAKHKKFTCEVCRKDVECQEREAHLASHHRQDLFKQTLDNGRLVGKLNVKVKPSPGYPLFLKTNYTKTRERHPEMDSKQVVSFRLYVFSRG